MEIIFALIATLVTLMILLLKLVIGGFLYFMPAIIAKRRHHTQTNPLFWWNLFVGWTGLGWCALAAWALFGRTSKVY